MPQISILTQNTFFIFTTPYIDVDPLKRIPFFIEYLANSNYDIVCLQEVFSSDLIGKDVLNPLLEGLEDIYPYTVKLQPQPIYNGIDSGLLLLSKYPIDSFVFHKYKSRTGIDALSDKGIIIAHIQIPMEHDNDKTCSLIIANTHLNAGEDSTRCSRIRRAQTIEAVVALRDFLESLKSKVDLDHVPVLVCGDFNISERIRNTRQYSNEYKRLLADFGDSTRDLYRELNGNEPSGYTCDGYHRLDYILGVSGKFRLIDAGVDDFAETYTSRFVLSDHLGMNVVIDNLPIDSPNLDAELKHGRARVAQPSRFCYPFRQDIKTYEYN